MCAGAAAGGLGLAGGGVALMAAGTPAWVPVALAVAGAAAAGGLIGSGYRTGQRTRLIAAAGSAVAGLLGLPGPIRASGRPVAAARLWRGSGVGSPRLVALHIPRQLSLDDADRAELAAAVGSVFGASYRCARRSRGRLLLHRYTPVPAAPVDPVVARIRRIVAELFGAAARVDGVQLAGGDVRGFRVGFDSSTRVNNAPWRAKAERHVSVMLPGRWRAHWDLEHDRVRFEVRPALPEVVAHPVPGGRVAATRELPIGVDEDGGPVTWRLKVAPHLLITGPTGRGKTVSINGVVAEATAAGWCVRIVDPKRIEFLALRGWSNVEIVATRVVDMIATIGATHRLMEQRYEQIEAGEASEDDFEPVILVLDEYRDLQSMVDFWWVSELKAAVGTKVKVPTKCPVYEWVGSIARKGRSADVHLVIGLQRPDAEFLTGEMRDNFTARLSLGRLSPQGAMMMWEAPHIGVAVPGIRGRGTANGGDRDTPVEVQTYWTPDPRRNRSTADRELLRQLWPGQAQHRPREVVVEDLSEDGTGLWKAIQHAELAPVPDDRLPAGPFPAEPSDHADEPGALHDAELGADGASPVDGAASPQPDSVDDQQDTDTGTAAVGAAAPSSRGLWPPVGRRIRRTGPVEADGDAVVLALPTRGRHAPAPAPAPERPEPPRDADDGDQADDTEVDGLLYDTAEPVSLAELVPGDLLEADVDGTPAWVVVAEAEPDVDDDGSYCVEYRADDGTDGQLVLPDDCLVQRRSPRV